MIATIDIALRAAGAFMLLSIAFLLVRQAFEMRQARFGALMAASLALVLVIDTPNSAAAPPLLRAAILPFSTNSAIFIWWFLQALLDDDFRLGRLEWGVAALWVAMGLPNYPDFIFYRPISVDSAAWVRSAVAAGITVHVIYIAVAGRNADLVEARRRVRATLAVVIAVLFAIDVAAELVLGYLNFPVLYSAMEAAVWLLVIFWSVSWLLRIDKSALMFTPPPPAAAPPAPEFSAKERLIHEKLVQVMNEEKAYLDPDLSIGALAERVGAPEHQLRGLINAAMGHRNFRAFLNEHRLAAVKRDLADPAKAALPILTLAMDSGFASLSSFNRAFKDATGKTPSEWRDEALARRGDAQN